MVDVRIRCRCVLGVGAHKVSDYVSLLIERVRIADCEDN